VQAEENTFKTYQAMNNTIHQPQEILLKVMCSERLPSEEGRYYTFTNISLFGINYFNGNRFETFLFIDVIAWYEPATRIVLTVEEWERLVLDKSNDEQDNEPYFGWCDVDGCDNAGSSGGMGWRDTGYWTLCSIHFKYYHDKKPQPKMKDESIKRESTRDEDGRLPITINP
jgi:hypothetical protein